MDALYTEAQVRNSQGNGHIWPMRVSNRKFGPIEPNKLAARTGFNACRRWHQRRGI